MSLPSGVVTFVFSDIEGSTRKWESDPEGMRASLARHDEIVAREVEAAGGHVFKHTGDGFGASFTSVSAGLEAAANVAAALEAAEWPGPNLTCRFGVHSGEAEPQDGDYFGATVTRTARLMDAGNGGQIIVSASAQALVRDRAPEGMTFVDAGEHRLKDLGEPIGLYRLVGAGAEDERQLRTLETAPHNLPVQLSSFVGREIQIKEISELVRANRLVTLTGIGGVGKTRLSLQVAAEVLSEFGDGAWFVELAPLTEAGLLPDTVGSALNMQQDTTIGAMERVLRHLRSRRAIIVIDNCEHLIEDVAEFVDELLRACPDVHVLTTSREGLAVMGEVLWRVPSLRVDDDAAAVELFAERARLVRPDFTVNESNREAVASLCQRLDGIPLAIELATARLKMLSVEQVAEHLGDRFRLLTGGSRTAVERQRTLLAMMDWSYELLDEREQALLRRLAVFYDGFSYEAAEKVCSGDTLPVFEVLDLLGRLVEASLVTFEDEQGVPRYRLLETVRQYSLDKLVAAGEADEARLRHAEWVREYAVGNDARIYADKETAMRDGDLELGNIRAALTWTLEAGEGVMAVEIAAGIRYHFWLRVMYDEALRWIRTSLRMVEDDDSDVVPFAVSYGLIDAGNIEVNEALDELVPRAERLLEGDLSDAARGELANAMAASDLLHRDLKAADDRFREAHIMLRQAGNDRWVAPLQNRVIVAYNAGDSSGREEIERLAAEAVAEGLGGSIHERAIWITFATLAGEYERVLELTEVEPTDGWEQFWFGTFRAVALRSMGRIDDAAEVLTVAGRAVGSLSKTWIGIQLAYLELQRGNLDEARTAYEFFEEDVHARNISNQVNASYIAAAIAAARDRATAAATLLGFADARAEQIGFSLVGPDKDVVAETRDAVTAGLASAFDTHYTAGAEMTWPELPMVEAVGA